MLYDRARLSSDASEMQRSHHNDDRIRKHSSQLITDASSQSIVTSMDRFLKAVNEMNTQVILPTKLLDVEESPGDDVPVMLRGGSNRYDFYQCLNVIKKDLVLGVTHDDEDSEDDYDDDYPTPLSNSRASPCKTPTRRHSTTCITGPRPQLSENLPTRKISLNIPPNLSRHENGAAPPVTSSRRQDNWASLDPLPEQPEQPSRRNSGLARQSEQPSRRKSGLASVNMRPDYHRQVSYDSGAECEDYVSDVMSPVEMAEQLREHLQGLQIGLNHLTNTANYITKSNEKNN